MAKSTCKNTLKLSGQTRRKKWRNVKKSGQESPDHYEQDACSSRNRRRSAAWSVKGNMLIMQPGRELKVNVSFSRRKKMFAWLTH